MSRKVNRRTFLKGATAGAVGVIGAAAFGVNALASSEEAGIYTPGTYSATANGIGEVTVTMTFDANTITDVVISTENETAGVGKELGAEFAQKVLDMQSAEIDAVSGASVTSGAVKSAVEACIAQAKGEAVSVGASGEASGDASGEASDGKSWRIPPDPIPDSEIAETVETDFAIVGIGYAGLCSMRVLGEAGKDVVGIEAMARDSWTTNGRDIGHINSKFLKEHGVPEVDPVEFMNNWMLATHNKPNPALVMKFAQNCGSAVDWFFEPVPQEILDTGRVSYWPENEYTIRQLNNGLRYYAGSAQFGPVNLSDTAGKSADEIIAVKDLALKNLEYIEAKCPTVRTIFGAKGQQLIKDGKRVTGVIVRKDDGSYVKVLANKGVVLSGGGFANNTEMCKDLLANLARNFTPDESFSSFMGRDGSTIQMGYWAGGRLESDIATMNHDSAGIPDSVPGALWIDKNGERFQNEAFAGTEVNGFFMARAKRGNITSVYDNTYSTQILRGYPGHTALDYADQASVDALVAKFEAARTAGAAGAGGYYCADTIEDLASYIGVDPAVMRKTVDRYNELCANGVDEDFGKDPRFMNPVAEPPFFAHITKPGLGMALVTTGGFVTTNDQQVLDEYFEPIEGLYASGNTCGMRFGPAYVTPIPGVSIGMCITLGRELGKHLATL